MTNKADDIRALKKHLANGKMQRGYGAIQEFLKDLKQDLQKAHPDFLSSAQIENHGLYYSYFAFTPPALKKQGLKFLFYFEYQRFSFVLYLSGLNRKAHTKTLTLFKEGKWTKTPLIDPTIKQEYITSLTLVEEADFDDPSQLKKSLKKQYAQFLKDVERFLAKKN